MKILIQGDLFVRVDIVRQHVERELAGLAEPLEVQTIELPLPYAAIPLPTLDDLRAGRLVTNEFSDPVRGVHEFYDDVDLLVEPARGADFLIVHTAAVTREVLLASDRLKAVVCGRGGPVNVNVRAATELGIPVINAPGRNAKAVAQFIIGLILAETRTIVKGWDGLKSGRWLTGLYHYEAASPGLDGAVLGMVGFGRVGRCLAPLARAFNMALVAYDPYVTPEDMAQFGVTPADSLDALIAQADYLTLLARYSAETHHLIGAREIALMKPTAYLVNTARGGLVDYDALYAALRDRRIKGALLDVYADEPLPCDSPLLTLDNVLLTPHIAGSAQETVHVTARIVAEEVGRMVRGERPLYCINPQVWDAGRLAQSSRRMPDSRKA